MSASRRAWRKVRHSVAKVLRNVSHDSSGRKRIYLGMLLLILRVLWIAGFTYVNSSDGCPENTGLSSAECKTRRAFRRRRPFPFPNGCSRQE